MTAVFVAVGGALAGTIIGAFLTQALQRRNAAYSKLHDARVEAYRTFTAAVMDYRSALMDRWFATNAGRRPSETENVYTTRSAVWAAYFQVVLVAGDHEIVARAERARDVTHELKRAANLDELDAAGDTSRVAIGRFTDAARDEVSRVRARGPLLRLTTGSN